MTNADTARVEDRFAGLTFPVVKVRYAGPTDHRGSRYIATLRGVRHVEHYDYALDGRDNAHNAAAACWQKYRDGLGEIVDHDTRPRLFVPGDLDSDSYSFTVVPLGFFTPGPGAAITAADVDGEPEPDDGDGGDPVKVTRTDYPGAPLPGDRFGWVIAAANGGHITEPYRDKSLARLVLERFAPDAHLVHVDLDWSEARA